jgi:hypothetical protein
MLTEFCVCGANLAETEEEARKYQGKFVESNFYHYEFLGEHFKTVKGYDAYQQKARIAPRADSKAPSLASCRRQAGECLTRSPRARSAAEDHRRFRTQYRFPLRRQALCGGRTRPEALCQRSSPGAQVAILVEGSGGSRVKCPAFSIVPRTARRLIETVGQQTCFGEQ